MNAVLAIFFLVTSIPACVRYKQQHDLEQRAATAVRTLRTVYVLTDNQSLDIVYANAWKGNVAWMEKQAAEHSARNKGRA